MHCSWIRLYCRLCLVADVGETVTFTLFKTSVHCRSKELVLRIVLNDLIIWITRWMVAAWLSLVHTELWADFSVFQFVLSSWALACLTCTIWTACWTSSTGSRSSMCGSWEENTPTGDTRRSSMTRPLVRAQSGLFRNIIIYKYVLHLYCRKWLKFNSKWIQVEYRRGKKSNLLINESDHTN